MRKILATMLPAAMSLMALTTACTTADGGDDQFGYYDDYSGAFFAEVPGELQPGDRFAETIDNPFMQTWQQPTSTFSVDADGASYAIMRRYVGLGYHIPANSVRIEEHLNYFTFDYAPPTGDHTVAINLEAGPCPWNIQHQLLRLGLKGKELQESEVPQANFVFLVDVSGSMNASDKLPLLKSGLRELLYKLRPTDRISLITYSGEVSKLLESTEVRNIDKITTAINRLKADGFTAGGRALEMAYEEALANYDAKANNRIIMGTDGDFNVGVTNADSLVSMVERYAKRGIYMTCLGFGTGNLNDAMMEKISNSGNGTYYYIDSEREMMKVFVDERERFVSVANDVKCQVTFDSTLVSSYRLIGYENRVMANEDFTNDDKDAGEIGAGQTITALYEVVPTARFTELLSSGSAEKHPFVTFDCRYKKALGTSSQPLSRELAVEETSRDALSPNLSLAAGVAAYGMCLRQSPYRGSATFDMASLLTGNSLQFDPDGRRAELLELLKALKVVMSVE